MAPIRSMGCLKPAGQQAASRLAAAGRQILPAVLIALMIGGVLLPSTAVAGGSRLIEVQDGEKTYTGKVVATDTSTCCLVDRQGQMIRLNVARLKSFRVIADRFQSCSTSEFRSQLLTEFPDGYEVSGTTHYLVCAATGRAQRYAELFEEIYRTTEQFYRVRGFPISTTDSPLVAIVLSSRQEFSEYCQADNVAWSPDLLGYYSLATNRVALFDDPSIGTVASADQSRRQFTSMTRSAATTEIGGDIASTIVHEAIHPVSFNMGVHNRIGGTPAWLVEGLATVMEVPGTLRPVHGSSITDRVNRERLNWFRQEYSKRQSSDDLSRLIATDDMFRSETLDAYSLGWAVTFFMTENPVRTRQLTGYLKTVAERDPLKPYSRQERLKDFRDAFGDPEVIQTEFRRFMDRLR
ncbi:MAG: DUF1570 domain-containing protein [Planctomycetaceae bacterium]|nr:DUF1570 domain-containing protein [Planctomycetaceae bacterium]